MISLSAWPSMAQVPQMLFEECCHPQNSSEQVPEAVTCSISLSAAAMEQVHKPLEEAGLALAHSSLEEVQEVPLV